MLIVDTSSDKAIVVLVKNKLPLQIKTFPAGAPLSKSLFPCLQELLILHSPSAIAVGIGPGTFTGTRVGATAAQLLSYSLEIPLLTFGSDELNNLDTLVASLNQRFSARDFASGPLPLRYSAAGKG